MLIRFKLCVILLFFLNTHLVVSRAEKNVTDSVKYLKVQLNSGYRMPMIGFGTWQIREADEIKSSLDYALEAGFRHIDTAQSYGNEKQIGSALIYLLPKHNLTREDIFITSKINPRVVDGNYYQAIKDSLNLLQTSYIDLYLIHNPATIVNATTNAPFSRQLSKGPRNAQIRDEKWKALVKAKNEGLVRSIGVSNYAVKHLKELLANDHGVKPAVNQIFWNPFNQPRDILNFCKKEGISVVGYSTLGSTGDVVKVRDDPRVKTIAEKLKRTPAQVLLRWSLQNGIAVIPKARSKAHIEENIALDFALPEEDEQILNSFEQKAPLFDIDNVD